MARSLPHSHIAILLRWLQMNECMNEWRRQTDRISSATSWTFVSPEAWSALYNIQGRIYSKPGPVQKKMWGPRAPNTIIGLQLSWVGVCQCVCQSTVQARLRWTLTPVPHKIFILFITSMTFGQFRCVDTLQKFFWSSCGASLLWGPLFGRTCWTCLNPPLTTS